MKIHFIGIGGIGVSGIASVYKQKGHEIQGSDAEPSEITADLQKQGIAVFVGQKASNIAKGIDFVIYSEAVPSNNPELKEARRLGIKCLSGAEALAELSKDYFLIAISGMHGKSTTASMISQILIKAGLDPTFIIGTKPGFRVGKSKYLVIEADDYQAKFLRYHPDVLVLTNIDAEHLDCLKNMSNIMKIFRQYVSQVKYKIIANKDNGNVARLLKNNKKTIFFSLKNQNDVKKLRSVLQVPGEHNVSNSLAALNAARLLKIDDKIAFEALSKYKGIWRRFQEFSLKIKNQKLKIISDYAHHPTEIKATLQALKEKYKTEKIVLFFQPHQYQRTYYLWKEFIAVFRQAAGQIDKIFITDIYDVKGREDKKIKAKISSQKLVKAIAKPNARYLALAKIQGEFMPDAINVIMGAGDIYRFPQDKLTNLK